MASLSHIVGNRLFAHCYPLYRPLYAGFKAVTDRAERSILRQQLRAGMQVVDGGANIGIYSMFMAGLIGPQGRVHSFEPAPDNFLRLESATKQRDNIVCNQAALGSSSRSAFLYLSSEVNVDHRAYETADHVRQAVPIRFVALDDYFPSGTRVDMIKMDIQGFEFAALQGAARVIEENRSLMLFLEFWPYGLQAAGTGAGALLDFLRNLEFEVAKIDAGGALAPIGEMDLRVDERVYCNLFARRAN